MKKYSFISKYPMITFTLIAFIVFILGSVISSLIITAIIVIPMYLAVRLFGNNR